MSWYLPPVISSMVKDVVILVQIIKHILTMETNINIVLTIISQVSLVSIFSLHKVLIVFKILYIH